MILYTQIILIYVLWFSAICPHLISLCVPMPLSFYYVYILLIFFKIIYILWTVDFNFNTVLLNYRIEIYNMKVWFINIYRIEHWKLKYNLLVSNWILKVWIDISFQLLDYRSKSNFEIIKSNIEHLTLSLMYNIIFIVHYYLSG